MNKLLFYLTFLSLTSSLFSQTSVLKGEVFDLEDGSPLIGATVRINYNNLGATTNFDGEFKIDNVKAGKYILSVSYIGYLEKKIEVEVRGAITKLQSIKLISNNINLSEMEVIADIAKERVTPVAATTISAQYIQDNLGNQEFPEILRNTPSVYVTKEGGGFGDSRINVRGSEQNNIAVMVNGVPVNDMESGWVYWSNWAGLADVTNKMQIQRGLGASKLAIPAIGGTINILTNAAEFKKGGNVSTSIGNNGYTKYVASLSSGLNEKGFAATMQLTYNKGNGYIQGTDFNAYSYFLSSTYNINKKHRVSATIIGAPQVHNRRSVSVFYDDIFLSTFRCPANDSIDKISKGNVVVKIMPNHLPSDWKKEDYLSFIDKIIPYFKHVILLDRKDINQQYISWRNLMNYLLNDDRYPEWTESKIKFGERFFWLQKYLIRQISSKYNLKLYFYEDIFFNNYSTMFDELNIDLDLVDTRYLDPQFKYKENVFKPELPKQLI